MNCICEVIFSKVRAVLSKNVFLKNLSSFWNNSNMFFKINSITISLVILFIATTACRNNIISEIDSRFGWETTDKYIYFFAFFIFLSGILISKIYYKQIDTSYKWLELSIIALYFFGAVCTIISFFTDKIPFEAVFCSLSTFICLDAVINNFFKYKDL